MRKSLKVFVPLLLIMVLALPVGCASKEAPAPPPSPMDSGAERVSAPAPALAPGSGSSSKAATSGNSQASTIDRKIVRTGRITLEVGDITKTMDEIARVANDLGGYVVSSSKSGDQDDTSGRVSIRVPVERFDEAFERLRKLAVKVPYESSDSKDVTQEYTDLKSQLRNLEATEAQYLALLQKAQTVEDILKVQQALSNVRGEIERVKGRIQYLERTSDMSYIEATLQQTKAVGKNGWDALGVLKSAVRGLVVFGKVLATIIIWVVIFCPIWVPILVVLLIRRRRRKAKAAKAPEPEDKAGKAS